MNLQNFSGSDKDISIWSNIASPLT